MLKFIDGLRAKINQGDFVKSVGILIGGTLIGQIITTVSSPLLTRLYTPEHFGLAATFSAIISLLSVIVCLSYQQAIPLPHNSSVAANIIALCLVITLTITLSILILLIFFIDPLVNKLNLFEIKTFMWFLPISLVLIGLYQVLNYWSIRNKLFVQIAKTKLSQGIGTIVVQLVGGFLYPGPLGLIVGNVVGQTAGTMTLLKSCQEELINFAKNITISNMIKAGIRYRRFPLFTTGSLLANSASLQIPIIMFTTYFSPQIAGFYILANTVLQMPMNIIGNSIGQVFFSEAATSNRESKLTSLTLSTIEKLIRIGVGPLTLLAIFAPELFSLVFGKQWFNAGLYARFLIPMILLVFIISPISSLVTVLEIQRGGLVFQLTLLASRIGAIGIGAFLKSSQLAVILYSISGQIIWIVFGVWILHEVKITFRSFLSILFKEFLVIAPIALFLSVIKKPILAHEYPIIKSGTAAFISISILCLFIISFWRMRSIFFESANDN